MNRREKRKEQKKKRHKRANQTPPPKKVRYKRLKGKVRKKEQTTNRGWAERRGKREERETWNPKRTKSSAHLKC